MDKRERIAHNQLIQACRQARDDARDLINHTRETIARSQGILRRAKEHMPASPGDPSTQPRHE